MSSEGDRFLELAAELGHGLADAAIWHAGRCSWIGATSAEEPRSAYAALGPDLYAGTSGVGLFLAEASAKLDDDAVRAAAAGAIRHAVQHADVVDAAVRDGLYSGTIGIAYAAARAARLLGDEEALAGAGRVLGGWRRARTRSPASDVASGAAGAVTGLLALGELVDEDWLVEAATGIGEELLARAEETPAGRSWPAPRQRGMQSLCGYAHGAAGIGHALVELFAVTGDERFRDAGAGAFAYVRSRLDARTRTWPDLRGVGRRASRAVPLPAAHSWCHGAAGIALSQVRAGHILGGHDGDIALAAVRLRVSELLAHGAEDFSLCHGAAGAGDVLLHCADDSGAATALGRLGLPRHGTPGLLPGLAGIGLFYLRLADRAVPTALLIHRRDRLDLSVNPSVQCQVLAEAKE